MSTTERLLTRKQVSTIGKTPFRRMKKCWQLYLMILLPVIYLLIFHYYPMYGVQIAFKEYQFASGIFGSPWVGMKHIQRFFSSYVFWRVIRNTIVLSLYGLIVGFPFPILLALSLNYVNNRFFKKTIQMVTYAPHFISTVVLVGMINQFFASRGIINNTLFALFGDKIDFFGNAAIFPSMYVWSGIWQSTGFGSIIYLAVLSNIDPQLHEAAIVDGATKMQRMRYVDLPGLIPTATILFIMNMGGILSVGFEKALLMQNPLNLSASEVISTYVYKVGLIAQFPDYSYSTAIGLFQSIVGLIFIVAVNRIARKVSETSLW